MRGLVWFRRDLRVADQPALAAALSECDEVVGLFIFDDPLLSSKTFGAACVGFMLQSLEELSESLAKKKVPLLWRRGIPTEELAKTSRGVHADAAYWNRDYEPSALERDRTAQKELEKGGVAVRTFKDHVVFEGGEILGASGDPLQRYGAYKARWWEHWRSGAPDIVNVLKQAKRAASVEASGDLPSCADLGYDRVEPAIPGGEQAAVRRLRWFVKGPLQAYGKGRNRPDEDGTSMLSPHFRFGTLSTRTAAREALGTLRQGGGSRRKDVVAWVDELAWRDFFQQVLFHFPRVATEPFRPMALPAWRTSDRLHEAWCAGRTGFPLVDAGMRQLNTTGWMHNRVRMLVASFLVKDLRLDWRLGERYFMQHLLDADLAANNGNWQWCASTGTDAMPGYRIFNPALQAEKFDPDGTYIRRFVPELARVATKHIHQPEAMTREDQERCGCRIGHDYPKPIVDHTHARQEFLARARRKN